MRQTGPVRRHPSAGRGQEGHVEGGPQRGRPGGGRGKIAVVYNKMERFFATLDRQRGALPQSPSHAPSDPSQPSRRPPPPRPPRPPRRRSAPRGPRGPSPQPRAQPSAQTQLTEGRVRNRRQQARTTKDAQRLLDTVNGRFQAAAQGHGPQGAKGGSLAHYLFNPATVHLPSPGLRRGYDGHSKPSRFTEAPPDSRHGQGEESTNSALGEGLVPPPRTMTKNYYR